jgi:hypothetical protein
MEYHSKPQMGSWWVASPTNSVAATVHYRFPGVPVWLLEGASVGELDGAAEGACLNDGAADRRKLGMGDVVGAGVTTIITARVNGATEAIEFRRSLPPYCTALTILHRNNHQLIIYDTEQKQTSKQPFAF